jgi:hypothetical protein
MYPVFIFKTKYFEKNVSNLVQMARKWVYLNTVWGVSFFPSVSTYLVCE